MDASAQRKTCKRYNEPGDAHYLTFSCFHRLPLLRSPRLCRWLAESIDQAREKEQFDLWGYVFMPEHVHPLIWPREKDYSVAAILQSIKTPTARLALAHLERVASPLLPKLNVTSADGRTRCHLWQRGGGYDRNLNTPKAMNEALDYIHNNPIRRTLTETATEWHWSSHREWLVPGSGPIAVDRTLPTLML